LKQDVIKDREVTLRTRDRAMYLAYNSCRVPLIIRIECLHIMVNHMGWSLDRLKQMLERAWTHCHQLRTTPLVVDFMHETQRLWVHRLRYSLHEMPELECKPPADGYAVKDRTKCL
jgi:hypothetical protein